MNNFKRILDKEHFRQKLMIYFFNILRILHDVHSWSASRVVQWLVFLLGLKDPQTQKEDPIIF